MSWIGPLELLFVGIIALIVFGPDRLPSIARTVGRTVSELRRQAAQVRAEFEESMDAPDTDIDPGKAADGDTSDDQGRAGP